MRQLGLGIFTVIILAIACIIGWFIADSQIDQSTSFKLDPKTQIQNNQDWKSYIYEEPQSISLFDIYLENENKKQQYINRVIAKKWVLDDNTRYIPYEKSSQEQFVETRPIELS